MSAEALDRPRRRCHHRWMRIAEGASQRGEHAGVLPTGSDRQGGETLLDAAPTPDAELLLEQSSIAARTGQPCQPVGQRRGRRLGLRRCWRLRSGARRRAFFQSLDLGTVQSGHIAGIGGAQDRPGAPATDQPETGQHGQQQGDGSGVHDRAAAGVRGAAG